MPDNLKPFALWLLVLSALATLAWPVALLLSVFIFDAPPRGMLDSLGRMALATLLLTYPWGFIVAAIRFLKRRKQPAWCRKSTAIMLAASLLQLLTPFVIVFVLDRHSK